jgi:hypothetical protein
MWFSQPLLLGAPEHIVLVLVLMLCPLHHLWVCHQARL